MRSLVVGLALAWSSGAFAQSAGAQSAGAQAEALFRQGKSLMTEGKTAEACTAFAESEKLEHAVTTLLNLAACREKNGQLASAWGFFLQAERETRAANDAATKQMHTVAQDRSQKLEARLSTLTIAVPDRVAGLSVSRDGIAIDAAAFDKPLPIDGGTYKIAAHAPGMTDWSTTIVVGAEHDAKSVEVPQLHALVAQPTNPPPPREPAVTPHRSHLAPILTGAGAVVLLGGAVGFDLWGNGKYDDAKAEIVSQAKRDALYDSANHKRYIAEGLGIAGIAAAGVTVWLALRHPDEAAATSHLLISPTGVGYVGAF